MYNTLRARNIVCSLQEVQEVVKLCLTCARFRRVLPRGQMGQPPYSLTSGHTVFCDVIGPLSGGIRGIRYIICVIDSITRVGDAMGVRIINGGTVYRMWDRWVEKYGQMSVVVTDNASYFRSNVVKDWTRDRNVEHLWMPPHHHESLGLVERYHQTLEDRIRKITNEKGGNWVNRIGEAVQGINSSWHEVIGAIPEELWNGGLEARERALARTVARRRKDDYTRFSEQSFRVGQLVLVYDAVAASSRENKFDPIWRGLVQLTRELSDSRWEYKEVWEGRRGPGRPSVQIAHVDHLQDYENKI